MKNYTIIILGFIILLTACRKESSITDGQITESEETELQSVVFKGTISDKGKNGLQSTIDIYQNEIKVGSVNSDEDGNYLTENIFIEPDIEITFDIFRTGYQHKYRRLARGLGFYDNTDFSLVSIEDAIGGPSQLLNNPGSDEYIKVYKTLLDVNGDPIPNIFSTVTYDHAMIDEFNFSSKGGVDITDEDGYMEVLLPKGEELFHFAAPFVDDANIECLSGSFHQQDTTLVNPFIKYQALGVVNDDHEITDIPDIAIHPTTYSVSGTLLNCDGSPVVNGEVTVRVTYALGTFPNAMQFSTTDIDAEGNYKIEFEICNYGEYSGTVTGIGDDGEQGVLLFTGSLGETQVDELFTCGNPLMDDSFMDLEIGNVKSLQGIQITQSVVTETSIIALGFHPDHGTLQLSVSDIELGDNPISVLNLNFPNPKPYSFISQDGELRLYVESIEDDYISGMISGSTETTELGVQEITGEIYIKYQ